MVLGQTLFSSTCGPPLAPNTAVSRDLGLHAHTISPSWALEASFKKSAAPPRCLAVSNSHVFAAQDQKAHVHVYSRLRGNQEALVPFQEKIRCLTLVGDVLVLGTADGRLILWETCTGRLATTPPCHIQAVSCLAATPLHLLSASDDSTINVWSLTSLLDLGADLARDPDRVLSNHRAAVTHLVVGPSADAHASLCVSASKDKTCILWNHRSGQLLRTLLFSATPLCLALDPAARALFVGADDGGLYLVELFGDKPLIGVWCPEQSSAPALVSSPLAVVDAQTGPPRCLAVNCDGTAVFTGHPKGQIMKWTLADHGHPVEMVNLNAAVTNVVLTPLLPETKQYQLVNVVKPNHTQRHYTLTAQLQSHSSSGVGESSLDRWQLETALTSFGSLSSPGQHDDAHIRKELEELRALVGKEKTLQVATA